MIVANIAAETPILESVFRDLADDACDISDIADIRVSPYSYRELADCVVEGSVF